MFGTNLPVNADFEAGFADNAEAVARNVARCVGTGVAGLSIEDGHGGKLYPSDIAVERVRAARRAIDHTGENVVLVGRCEAYLMDPLDLDEVIRRLMAYSEAGADCRTGCPRLPIRSDAPQPPPRLREGRARDPAHAGERPAVSRGHLYRVPTRRDHERGPSGRLHTGPRCCARLAA
jgi:phosphoenolpyruvate phosphomutase-like protein